MLIGFVVFVLFLAKRVARKELVHRSKTLEMLLKEENR